MPIDDATLIAQINVYTATNPHASRADFRRKFSVGTERLQRLHDAGLIVYPPPMNPSIAATLNRKRKSVMQGWYINKPASWEK